MSLGTGKNTTEVLISTRELKIGGINSTPPFFQVENGSFGNHGLNNWYHCNQSPKIYPQIEKNVPPWNERLLLF